MVLWSWSSPREEIHRDGFASGKDEAYELAIDATKRMSWLRERFPGRLQIWYIEEVRIWREDCAWLIFSEEISGIASDHESLDSEQPRGCVHWHLQRLQWKTESENTWSYFDLITWLCQANIRQIMQGAKLLSNNTIVLSYMVQTQSNKTKTRLLFPLTVALANQ